MQVGQARLVGECYNYRLLPSRVVVDTLHVMLAVGHGGDAAASLAADPPSSYFRIRCPPPPPSGPARAPAPLATEGAQTWGRTSRERAT